MAIVARVALGITNSAPVSKSVVPSQSARVPFVGHNTCLPSELCPQAGPVPRSRAFLTGGRRLRKDLCSPDHPDSMGGPSGRNAAWTSMRRPWSEGWGAAGAQGFPIPVPGLSVRRIDFSKRRVPVPGFCIRRTESATCRVNAGLCRSSRMATSRFKMPPRAVGHRRSRFARPGRAHSARKQPALREARGTSTATSGRSAGRSTTWTGPWGLSRHDGERCGLTSFGGCGCPQSEL